MYPCPVSELVMSEQLPRLASGPHSLLEPDDPVANACHRHLAGIAALAASIEDLPHHQPHDALQTLLMDLSDCQRSGEELAQALHQAPPPVISTPLPPPQTATDPALAALTQRLISWAAEHHWDSRYLAPADEHTLDPLETIVRDAAQDLAQLAVIIHDIQSRWQHFRDAGKQAPEWLADVAFFHVHSPWRSVAPRLWAVLRALHTTVDDER